MLIGRFVFFLLRRVASFLTDNPWPRKNLEHTKINQQGEGTKPVAKELHNQQGEGTKPIAKELHVADTRSLTTALQLKEWVQTVMQ